MHVTSRNFRSLTVLNRLIFQFLSQIETRRVSCQNCLIFSHRIGNTEKKRKLSVIATECEKNTKRTIGHGAPLPEIKRTIVLRCQKK